MAEKAMLLQTDSTTCARELLDLTPQIMCFLRQSMRGNRAVELSVVQFRTLVYLRRHPGASLNEAAMHIGLSTPAMSKLVDVLAQRELLVREQSQTDRRRVVLNLAPAGMVLLASAHDAATEVMAERLNSLSPDEIDCILQSLHALRRIFGSGGTEVRDA